MTVYLQSKPGGLKPPFEGFEYNKECCFKEKVMVTCLNYLIAL